MRVDTKNNVVWFKSEEERAAAHELIDSSEAVLTLTKTIIEESMTVSGAVNGARRLFIPAGLLCSESIRLSVELSRRDTAWEVLRASNPSDLGTTLWVLWCCRGSGIKWEIETNYDKPGE